MDQLAPRYCRKTLSRLRLEVLRLSGEFVKQITEEEARLEGCERSDDPIDGHHTITARDAFSFLWDDLHDKDGERWDDDPGVFVVAFDEWERRAAGERVADPRP